MRRIMHLAIAVGFLGVLASPAMAQGEGETTTNVFQMFFFSANPLGLAIIWLLLAMSMVSFALAGSLYLKSRRSSILPDETYTSLEQMLQNKQYQEAIEEANNDTSYLGRLVSSALNEARNGYPAMERAIDEAAESETTKILRPFEYLNVMGQVSPMIGLFGTVFGMILAFQELVSAGGRPDPADLAAGISTALVTTFWGLIVAIPAMTFYSLLRNSADASCAEGVNMAEELIAPFKPTPGQGGSSSRSGSSSGGGGGGGGTTPRRKPAAPKPDKE